MEKKNSGLEEIYEQLDFQSGELFKIAQWQEDRLLLPPDEVLLREKWIDACLRINEKYGHRGILVDALFFVQQNPIAVFASVNQRGRDLKNLAVRTIWNLARPRYLFLNDPIEPEVYEMDGDLNLESPLPLGKGLPYLLKLNRDIIQNGYDLLRDKSKKRSADVSLIHDLKELRRIFTGKSKTSPIKATLTYHQAHTLIAQVIFIRYLEDRNILDEAYFKERVAENNERWQSILSQVPDKSNLLNPDIAERFFPRILADRDFTVALFQQLAADFNGDIFSADREYAFVQAEHLRIIQRFLWANMEAQQKLFLWAYQFDVIPLELISSIYEEFYHGSNKAGAIKDENGTHYTPSVLVEFMLSRVLTAERLKTSPRVLDAACGSGIFLVEAFRRIVRYKMIFEGYKPAFKSLTEIIGQQIRGIEINREAARVTAFSLYIALLDFLDPPHIRHYLDEEDGKLPYLLYSQTKTELHLNIILDANAFWVEDLFKQDTGLHDFQPGSVDIVIGNPPWGSATKKDVEDGIAIKWCTQNGFPVSDNEWSQMFIWRSMSLLKPGGEAALLVSSGTLLKSSDNAVEFKQKWTSQATMLEVFNFVLSRHVFFEKAISPFLGVVFRNVKPSLRHIIQYWTFRRTRLVERCQVVVLDKTDFKLIPQSQTQVPTVWKTNQFGNQSDFALLSGLEVFEPLEELELKTGTRQGFIEGKEKSKKKEVPWMKDLKMISVDFLKTIYQYDSIDYEKVLNKITHDITRTGAKGNYEGLRILFKCGISSEGINAGNLWVRLETEKFAFTDAFNIIKLKDNDENKYKLLTGILWSSFAKYYYFMTVSHWGVWRDSVKPSEMVHLPIPEIESSNKQHADKIVQIVDKLRQNPIDIAYWEKQLDETVFDYYYLTAAEKDLIRDRCDFEIDAYYKNHKSLAFSPVPGLLTHLKGAGVVLEDKANNQTNGILTYLDSFYQTIQPLLKEGMTLTHIVVRSKGLNPKENTWTDVIAAIFFIKQAGESHPSEEAPIKDWADVVRLISDANRDVEISRSIYQEHFLRMVSDAGNSLFILKRNERRLWTRTAAREDAQALFAQSLSLSQTNPNIL